MFSNKVRRAVEKLISPGGNISYAQAGEDLVLDFLVNYAPKGFYVDVGANHPIRSSNTYRFYCKGWHGIAIDANKKFASEFAKKRPRDRFVKACVGNESENVQFHHFKSDALSSVSGARLYANPEHYSLLSVETMTTRSLTAVLEEAKAPLFIDILSIDVEGHGEAALRSIDLDRYRVRIIVIELNSREIDLGRVAESWAARHLAQYNYRPVAVHWSNVFFSLTREALTNCCMEECT